MHLNKSLCQIPIDGELNVPLMVFSIPRVICCMWWLAHVLDLPFLFKSLISVVDVDIAPMNPYQPLPFHIISYANIPEEKKYLRVVL